MNTMRSFTLFVVAFSASRRIERQSIAGIRRGKRQTGSAEGTMFGTMLTQ